MSQVASTGKAHDADTTVCLVERVMWVCFQVRTNLASRTSCWRKSTFSAVRSDLLLPRSLSVASGNERVSGLVQRTQRGEAHPRRSPSTAGEVEERDS